jgi:Family of unknown function (DUF5681)
MRGRNALPSTPYVFDRKESQAMPFQKGQSGNPAGRPPGSRNKTAIALQELLEHDAESIARM